MRPTVVLRAVILSIFATSIMLAGSLRVQAQENFLINPGFESGFVDVGGDQPRSVGSGWTPWNAARTADMPSFQNAQPIYIAASAAPSQGITPRIRTGSNAQIFYSFFETHDAGVYQQISGISPGTELRFSVYSYIWSSTFEDPNVSEDPGDVAIRVGIDPTGGTDPFSSSVIYSTPAVFYDTYRQYSIIATAQSSTVTVFVRSTVGAPVQNTYVYLDDAELASTTDTPAATATTAPPTATATSVVVTTAGTDPTPTSEGSTMIQTTTPTPVLSATQVVVPSATPVPAVGGPISATFPGTIVHRVSDGETVGLLALIYGSSTEAIIEANGLDESAFINAGQSIVIPVRLVPATEVPGLNPVMAVATQAPIATQAVAATVAPTAIAIGGPTSQQPTSAITGTTEYTVQRGDTLSRLAVTFNTTIDALVQLNGIANPNQLIAGQLLRVPGTGGAQPGVVATSPVIVSTSTPVPQQPVSYVVQPGDNLYRISLRLGVSMAALASANNITNFNRVFAGQVLIIPA